VLIKFFTKNNPRVMALFKYAESDGEKSLNISSSILVEQQVISIGESCELKYESENIIKDI
jgi:hypothetical protein